jgi:uncharacterized protein
MNPVLITPQELAIHRIVVSKGYAAGELDYYGSEFRQIGTLKVGAAAELVGAEIRIRGHVEGKLEICCARCLGSVEFPVDRDFEVFYRPMKDIARDEEVEISAEELEVGFYEGEGINFEETVTEQVILSVPMKVVCGTDCRGLCPICGTNLNEKLCNCPPPGVSSPFASLK